MLSKLRVGIICGGCSLEHEISLQSAMYINQSIDKNRFETLILWINKKGNWYIISKSDFSLISCNKSRDVSIVLNENDDRFNFYFNNLLELDVVFPIIHGTLGEDGALQGFLRIIDIPYVGSDVLGSAICINKDITRCLLSHSGISVIPFETFLFSERSNIDFYDLIGKFGLPLFIKPVNQGSSIGGSKVDNVYNFCEALDVAFSCSYRIIIEPFIIGRELECAVLGNNNPKASLCGEIVLKNNDFYNYNDKYIQHDSQIIIPAIIDDNNSDRIRNISVQAFRILHCFGMARVDVFLTMNNQILVNEVNTLPGFTNSSMYPKLWEATGLQVKKLLTKLIELALDRHHDNYC